MSDRSILEEGSCTFHRISNMGSYMTRFSRSSSSTAAWSFSVVKLDNTLRLLVCFFSGSSSSSGCRFLFLTVWCCLPRWMDFKSWFDGWVLSVRRGAAVAATAAQNAKASGRVARRHNDGDKKNLTYTIDNELNGRVRRFRCL
jgi:hypothetical protein